MLVKAEEAENERQKAIKAESDRKPYNRYMDFIGIISKYRCAMSMKENLTF